MNHSEHEKMIGKIVAWEHVAAGVFQGYIETWEGEKYFFQEISHARENNDWKSIFKDGDIVLFFATTVSKAVHVHLKDCNKKDNKC